MRLAVCSQGKDLESPVDSRFARCWGFVIFDTDTNESIYLVNSATSAAHGAGSAAVQALCDAGVEAVCAEHIGSNAYAVLAALGITMYRSEGAKCVRDAVLALKAGNLATHDSPTTSAH